MTTPFYFLPLAAVFQTAVPQQEPDQVPTDRRVRIEIVTTENGETKRVTREFDATDDAQVEDALRELGVLEHMSLGNGERNLTIDIRGFGDDEEDGSMFMRMAPMPPIAPEAPDAPMAVICEKSAYLGVSTQELNEELVRTSKAPNGGGAYVNKVVDDTPAAKLGLQEGDVITELDGETVTGPETLAELVRSHEPGEKVKVTWYREGRKMNGTAELAEHKEMSYSYNLVAPEGSAEWDWENYLGDAGWSGEPRAFLGVTPADGDDAANGASIGSVEEGTAAATMGIAEGDVITSVNGKAITSFLVLAETIGSMDPGDEVHVTVLRNGNTMNLSGTLGETEGNMIAPMHGMNGFDGMAPADRDELPREMDH